MRLALDFVEESFTLGPLMKALVATLLVSAILFFLSCGNALSFRFASDSIHAFRLRRREYLTQVLKQVSLVSTQVKSATKSTVQSSGHKLVRLTKNTAHYFSKNASIVQITFAQPIRVFFSQMSAVFSSLMMGPPLLPPPIA
jgi:hypothetical protein